MKLSNILVVGGGITGITAALDLASQKFHVFLVEKTSSIGGKMSQLDKTFPTLDCSICILAPRMVEVARHPYISLLTYAEVESCEKTLEDTFHIRIKKKARYVELARCTGCGICIDKCPVKVPNEFESGLTLRSAIYIPFPQAVPRKATIDIKSCIGCGVCKGVCKAEAINYEMKDEVVELDVASVILATGFDLIKPTQMKRYNYGVFKNVLTAAEYERVLSASGPFTGTILRPSDGDFVKKIAFILCVGSRNLKIQPYCSKFCCMYSTKEAIITKEHAPETDVTLFYNDLRVIGKNQEEFLVRAKEEYGIHFFRGIPGDIQENPVTRDLVIRHANLDTGEVEEDTFNLVVLASAITPGTDTDEIARRFGIKTNAIGFFDTTNSIDDLRTGVEGIFATGCCQGPDDIASCVAKGSAAAALAGKRAQIASEPLKQKELVPSIPVMPEDPPRIGVFVCQCGINIGGHLDVKEAIKYAKTLPDVVFAMDNLYTCSEDSQQTIKKAILEQKLNRVIVASCTPRTHESLFRETLEEVGLNPYLFQFVSIRELDSWVHMHKREAATTKAKDLIRIGVSSARHLKPLSPFEGQVVPKALVIGGGISGMVAAQQIADRGFKVHLVERQSQLGGLLEKLHRINQDLLDPKLLIKNFISTTLSHPNIHVHLGSEVTAISGSIGAFNVTIEQKKSDLTPIQDTVGAVIIATGATELKPHGYYHYGESKHIHTQLELADILNQNENLSGKNIVFIHCVGSREPTGRTYCSLICCGISIKNALLLKQKYPSANIFVLYRDIRVGDIEEQFYWKAREDVNYIRWTETPEVTLDGEKIAIRVKDINSQEYLEIPADELFLSTPLISYPENKQISELLKIPRGPHGFFLEAHPKLRPLDFATDGVYLCGTCQGPKRISDAINQALGAASRALIPLLNGKIVSEPITAYVNQDLCIGCEVCANVCSYGAVGVELDSGSGKTKSEVNPLRCKGCGACAAACPALAIEMHHFSTKQLRDMVEQAISPLEPPSEPRIVAFLCNWCSYAGADNAGVSRYQYPPNIRPIRVMCSGRVDPVFILQAFLDGADGVYIGGCHIGDCHYIGGNLQTRDRITILKERLKDIGIDPRRLRLEWVSASEGKRFAEVVTEFTEYLKKLPKLLPIPTMQKIIEVTK